MPDQLTSPASARSRTVLKRNASSRSSMVVNSAVSFFKQSRSGHQHHPTLVEDPGLFSDNEDDDTLFYDTVYPLTYDRELVTFDVLDHYFLTANLGGPTLHKFKNEPLDVLDIGCGAGTWMIDTARAWVLTHFVGLDANVDMHPSLAILQPPDLRERIRWVQADFLERLPFASESFDFVRVAKIAMAVPEAKWPRLIGEISRIMRPGGTFEIIEENLILPLPHVRPLKPSREEHAEQAAAAAQAQTQSQGSDNSISWHGADSVPRPPRPSLSIDAHHRSRHVSPPRPTGASPPRPTGASPPRPTGASPPPYAAPDLPEYTPRADGAHPGGAVSPLDRHDRDPRDHRKLKRAWDAMLAARGINASPLSILSLYILAEFEHLDTSAAPIVVPMPGPSRATRPGPDDDGDDDEPPPPPKTADAAAGDAPLHLLRGLATVRACRDALLPHFQHLYPDRPREKRRRGTQTQDRSEFDAVMANYERDMLDRVGMGQRLQSTLGWKAPAKARPSKDSKDEFSRWREDIRTWRSYEQDGTFDPDIDVDVCRTLRILSATKRDPD